MGRKKKIAALCGGIAVAAVIGYAAYVLLTYHRIPDGKETGIEKKAEGHVLKEEQSYFLWMAESNLSQKVQKAL